MLLVTHKVAPDPEGAGYEKAGNRMAMPQVNDT